MRQPRKTKLTTTSKSQPARFPAPFGIWYTDDNLFADPDNVTAAECELMAIVPMSEAHDYARHLYEESQNESDNWQTVQIFARPADREGWHLSQGYDRTTNADPIITALVDYLTARFGGVWEITPTGGGCEAITCEGTTYGNKGATLSLGYDATVPVVGMDQGAGVMVEPTTDHHDPQYYNIEARSGRITAEEIADLVAFAIADTRFTPSPILI